MYLNLFKLNDTLTSNGNHTVAKTLVSMEISSMSFCTKNKFYTYKNIRVTILLQQHQWYSTSQRLPMASRWWSKIYHRPITVFHNVYSPLSQAKFWSRSMIGFEQLRSSLSRIVLLQSVTSSKMYWMSSRRILRTYKWANIAMELKLHVTPNTWGETSGSRSK